MPDPAQLITDRILLVSYGGGHAAMLAPVAEELRNRGRDIAILALTTAPQTYRRFGLDTFGFSEIIDHVTGYETAREVGARLGSSAATASALVPQAETEAYMGVGYLDLLQTLGKAAGERCFSARGRQSFLPKPFFQQLFEQFRPRALVATNSPRSERAALESAGPAGIPSVCLVDLYARWEIEWCAQPGYADRICILNAHVADQFAARGVPNDRLAVTGNPAFDRLLTLDYDGLRHRARSRLGIGESERVVAFISQPEPEMHPFSFERGDSELPLRIERALAASFQDEPGVVLMLRLHPSEARDYAISGPRIVHSAATEPLDEILCAADCIVTSSSTVGLEAGLLGIPVVQTMLSIFSADLPLADMGYAEEAHTIADIAPAIRKALARSRSSGSTQQRPATPMIADIIEEIAAI